MNETNLLNEPNPTVSRCQPPLFYAHNLTNRLMILNKGVTVMDCSVILNYWSDEQYLIFWHWQLKSILNAVKNICFLLLLLFSPHSRGLAGYPGSNDMINVPGESHATSGLTVWDG